MDFIFDVFGLFFKLLFTFGGLAVSALLIAFAFGWIKEFTQRAGTATIWEEFGEYCATTMQYPRYHFDDTGFIITGLGAHSTGHSLLMSRIPGTSYIFYVAGLVRPKPYDEFNDKDGFGDGVDIFLHEQRRTVKMSKVETNPGQGVGAKAVAVDITGVYGMRPVNPERFAYQGPKDIVAVTDQQMRLVYRDYVQAHTVDEVKAMKSNSQLVWDWIVANCQQTIDYLRNMGVEIISGSVSIEDIGFQEKDQDAQAETQRSEWQAQAESRKILGTMLENVAFAKKLKNADEARAALQATPEGQKLMDELTTLANQTIVKRKVAEAGGIVIEGLDRLIAEASRLVGTFTGGTGGTPLASPPIPPPPPAPPAPPSPPQPPADPGPAPAPTTHKPPKKEKSQAEKAEAWFKAKGVYPKWDPLKRTPN